MLVSSQKTNRPQSLAEFQDWELIDGYKYEWNDGEIIKFEKIKKKHLFIIRKLSRIFAKTVAYKNGGEFITEQDIMLTGIQMRRPDLAYFSGSQIDRSVNSDEEPIPEFVVEVISPTDDIEKVEEKVVEYFKAGVGVVWHIFPENQVIYVYTSRKQVTIYTEDDICSAAPILPDFGISVNELFAKI